LTVYLMRGNSAFHSFVRCLESLSNLHTLEIGWTDGSITIPLKNALKRLQLPQIKTLILPPAAYPLLQNCRDVEDVVCVITDNTISTDEFLGCLTSNRDSKLRRLAIPLVSWGNPSQHVAALSRLTELTLIYPHPDVAPVIKAGIRLDNIGTVRPAALELVHACRALPDFDTLQIVYFLLGEPLPPCGCVRMSIASTDLREQALREQVRGVKDLVVDTLKEAKAGYREVEGRKKVTVEVIELSPRLPLAGYHLGSVEAEVFEV